MIRFTFECDTQEDLEAVRQFFIGTTQERTANAKRQKRYRDNKKRNESVTRNVTDRNETVTNAKEERDEERAVSPLDSPLPFPPKTPNPITPLIPSSQKEAEREEKVLAPAIAKRGELRRIGPFVLLSDDELRKLEDKFGKRETETMIQAMNNYIGEDPKRQRTYASRNHYLTLLNWKRMDEQRKQAKQIPKEQTFRDLRVKMEQEQEANTIDSFWRV